MLTGTEHILFVDDEPFQTDIAKRMLTRLGYPLTTCTSSIEALDAFRQTPEVFDLVITDMTMPCMPGDVLAKELIVIRPDIPVIVCTGYSERINSDVAAEIGIRELVMKPVVIKDLAEIIRRVMDDCRKQPASSAGGDSRLR
jgi:CheY-like chemotaxis protein